VIIALQSMRKKKTERAGGHPPKEAIPIQMHELVAKARNPDKKIDYARNLSSEINFIATQKYYVVFPTPSFKKPQHDHNQ
jgi:hypothetical protein